MLAKVMVCAMPDGREFCFMAQGWSMEQSKEYATRRGFQPLYCVNIRRKK